MEGSRMTRSYAIRPGLLDFIVDGTVVGTLPLAEPEAREFGDDYVKRDPERLARQNHPAGRRLAE